MSDLSAERFAEGEPPHQRWPVGSHSDPTVANADERWMRRAIVNARRGAGRTTPNPIVGACVVTPEGIVVGDGTHERAGEPHAEVHALNEAGERAKGATLYCTLEPCVHTGRTGPCTERIIAAGIARVVAAMEDPFPLVSGKGFAALRAHGIAVETGVESAAAARLNQPFLTAVRERRPFITLKAATSLDGRIAASAGTRTPLTSAPAVRHAHYHRAQADAVAVGSGTILADDPLLTAREVYRERPLARVIFDRRLRTSPAARVFSTLRAGPVIILTTPESRRQRADLVQVLERAGATVVDVAAPDFRSAVQALVDFDIQSVILEGGAAVHGAAWAAGVVDFVQLYIAPAMIGEGGVPLLAGQPLSLAGLVETRIRQLGPDVLIEGYVHRPH